MSLIAEAALSAFFDVLFNKLVSSELLNLFASEAQVRGEIKKWEKKLRKLHLVLEDAEEKQIQNRLVKAWLGELKHLAYDVEDILDEFSTECLRRKVMGEPQTASTSKFRKCILTCCSRFNPRDVLFNSDTMSKIGDITVRLTNILDDMKDFNLVEKVVGKTSKDQVSQRTPTTSLPDETKVYGRDGDKDKILGLLLSNETSDSIVDVIPIVGMGGMGKTTLAKLVYNDDSIPHHFQIKAWVCVSDVFDITRVTTGILESITSQNSDLKELNQLQLMLKEKLAGKKFLIVLDDVWTETYDDWHALRTPLMDGARGSKIVVTTRSITVANMMGTIPYHVLKQISDDDCWSLFAKHAFGKAANPELEKVGRAIVKNKCGGLPLAARTLGGLLRSRRRKNEWEEVLNNKLWNVFDGSNNIIPALELSFHYLPSHLKRCFAYCAVFPKDYEFEKDEIILLWMAEGLIPLSDDKKKMDDLGSGYFLDLLSRSLFQTSSIDESRFIMHDLVNDLAQKVAEDTCFRLEDKDNFGEESKRKRARHSSYIQYRFEAAKRFVPFHTTECLRTFLPFTFNKYSKCYLSESVPWELLKNLRFLRVLSLSHYLIRELPDSIGGLKHLRYLDLSHTRLEVLPESTTSLYNLQSLILQECCYLKKLPTRMDNLINLCNLDLSGTDCIEGMPLEMKELRGLRTLSNFVVGKGSFTITTLMSLKSLQGKICISNLDHVASVSDAKKARLKDKEGIRVLDLIWNKKTNIDVQDGEVQCNVIEELKPHINLEKLIIRDYAGTRFPSWLEDPTYDNIVHLRLEGCKKCTSLPQLGMLISLKELVIIGMTSLQKIDQEFHGSNGTSSFPSLEVLYLQNMDDLEELCAFDFGFKVLRELFIINCGKLSKELRIHPPLLEKLIIRDCKNLALALLSLPMLSALEIGGCKEVDFRSKDDFNSLKMIVLSCISSITNLTDVFVQRLKKFKKLTISSSPSEHTIMTIPSTLEKLRPSSYYCKDVSTLECVLEGCPQLKMLMMADEDKDKMHMELEGSDLECVVLKGCERPPRWMHKLEFLSELWIGGIHTFPKGGLPCMLKVLTINCCHTDGAFSNLIVCNSHSLQELVIENCDSLISFGRMQLRPSLKKLRIEECNNLKSLVEEDDFEGSLTNLQDLDIQSCPNLTSIIPKGKLPSLLQYLNISRCSKLESIVEKFDHNTSLKTLSLSFCASLKSLPEGLQNLINLHEFTLYDCKSIVSFPQGGLPAKNLRGLSLHYLPSLNVLPDNIHTHSSLQSLKIWSCPNLVLFPSHGLPCNLTILDIVYTKFGKAMLEWGLDGLNSLKELALEGCPEVVSFPPDETQVMLPPSLTHIIIMNFPNLKYLSTRGFQNLTSLQFLHIGYCSELTSFPENGLPDSLLELWVRGCSLLEQRCQEGQGPEWSKIANIPYVSLREGGTMLP